MAANMRLSTCFLCDLCFGLGFGGDSSVGLCLQLESCNASGNKRQVGEGVRNENMGKTRQKQRVNPK